MTKKGISGCSRVYKQYVEDYWKPAPIMGFGFFIAVTGRTHGVCLETVF